LNLPHQQEKDAALIHRHTSTLHRCNGHPRMKTETRFEEKDERWRARDEWSSKAIQEAGGRI